MSEHVKIELTGIEAKLRAAISDTQQPDALAIADELIASLDEAEVQIGLRRGLRLMVERTQRSMRSEAMRRAREDAERIEAPRRREARKVEAAKQLAEIARSHEELVAERFFSTWKETPTGRKFLGECTVEDLTYSRDRSYERSTDHLRAGNADDRLIDAMTRSKCGTVRDLGYEIAAVAVAGRTLTASEQLAA